MIGTANPKIARQDGGKRGAFLIVVLLCRIHKLCTSNFPSVGREGNYTNMGGNKYIEIPSWVHLESCENLQKQHTGLGFTPELIIKHPRTAPATCNNDLTLYRHLYSSDHISV